MDIKRKSLILVIFNLIVCFILYLNYPALALSFFELVILFIFFGLALSGIIFWIYLSLKSRFTKEVPTRILEEWYHLKLALDIVFLVALFIKFLFFQPFYISGNSMEPSFHDGNLLIIEKISYWLHKPQRGDVIIFHYPKNLSKIYIKRIIGLPGEKITIKEGKIKIYNSKNTQGTELSENYIKDHKATLGITDLLLANDEYFVLGDNRDPNASSDSREWGPLKEKYIIGHAWLRVWPPGQFGTIQKPKYNLVTYLLNQLATAK